MKRGKPTFPSLFTFYSQFAAVRRVYRDIPVTGQASGQRGRITFSTQRAVGWLALPTLFVFLQFTQFAPALVLLFLGRVGIFVPLQPEGEPVDSPLLCGHSFEW